MNDQLKTQFSSKLTQLTRIIYLLNAKNEEHELMLETIISNIEKEHNEKISKLYNKINSQINEFKNLKKLYEEKYENFKLEVEYKCNRVINKIQKEYNEFKDNKKNINEDIKYEFEIKVNSMSNQLKQLKDDYAKNVFEQKDKNNKLSIELEDYKKNYDKKVIELKEENDKIIEKINSEMKKKISDKDIIINDKN